MGETAMLVASLKDVIRNQAKEIDTLRAQLQELTATAQKPNDVCSSALCYRLSLTVMPHVQSEALRAETARLTEELHASDEKRREVEKEQEDLLVLLDELNSKRRRDKQRMREASMEVSEDEADDEDEDEGEE